MPRHIPGFVDLLWRLRPKRILDIGPGFGLNGAIARQYLDVFGAPVPYGEHRTTIDCIEVHEPYITGLHRAVYDHIAIGDALDVMSTSLDAGTYDLVLLLDVLEHFERERGLRLLAECRRVGSRTLVNVPYPPGPQGTVFGNTHEAHISAWEPDDFGARAILEKDDALIVLMESNMKEAPCPSE